MGNRKRKQTKSITLAVVQFSPRRNQVRRNLERLAALTESLDADIIVFPELCTSGYFFVSRQEVARVAEPADGSTGRFFGDLAAKNDAMVVAGFAESDGARLYNACIIVDPQSKTRRVYRKTHLFYKEQLCFDGGDSGFFVVEDPHRRFRLGPMICYDWRFPEAARSLMLLGADVIACPANLVTDAWQLVMPARAIENKVYVAVANRTGTERRGDEQLHFKGRSAIYGYDGKPLAKAPGSRDRVLAADIFPFETRDKAFNAINDVRRDRRPQYYMPLVQTADLYDV